MSAAPILPAFLQSTLHADNGKTNERVLVVVQMDGGNDGLNTVIPYAQDEYYRRRPELGVPKDQVIRINDSVGFHPAMRPLNDLMEKGRFSVVQDVGYPNPDRSHFRSMAIWHTAESGDELPGYGWIARALDDRPTGNTDMFFVGDEDLPLSLRGRRVIAGSLAVGDRLSLEANAKLQAAMGRESQRSNDSDSSLSDFVRRNVLDAYQTASELSQPKRSATVAYPGTGLAQRLKTIAGFIAAKQPAKVYYAIQSGYDTHENQLSSHGQLLAEFAGAVGAFMEDIAELGLLQKVVVVAFSEFGRRVGENGSVGTDHGTAGPVFLAGESLKRPFIGTASDLSDLDGDDLRVKHDFRQVYATLLEDWLEVPSKIALGHRYEKLPLFT